MGLCVPSVLEILSKEKLVIHLTVVLILLVMELVVCLMISTLNVVIHLHIEKQADRPSQLETGDYQRYFKYFPFRISYLRLSSY